MYHALRCHSRVNTRRISCLTVGCCQPQTTNRTAWSLAISLYCVSDTVLVGPVMRLALPSSHCVLSLYYFKDDTARSLEYLMDRRRTPQYSTARLRRHTTAEIVGLDAVVQSTWIKRLSGGSSICISAVSQCRWKPWRRPAAVRTR